MIIDWTALDEDNAELQKKTFPMATVRSLQKAMKALLAVGEMETAEKFFAEIKMFFKKNNAEA